MKTANKRLAFSGQWIDGTPVGDHIDSDGDAIKIDEAFLNNVVANFNETKHLQKPPAVIGHPEHDAPAYGWVEELRVNNGRLERRFSEVQPGFEEMVRSGAYKKRSDAFYLSPKKAPGGKAPALRHVGFLGAMPPAIKGIADIQFSEDEGKTVDVEVDTAITFSEGDDMDEAQVKKTVIDSIKEFFKGLGGGGDKPAASFSESDRKKLTDDVTAALELKFSEELKTRDTKIEELTNQVNSQSGSSTHAANVEFCEKRPDRIPSQLKDRYVALLDGLAGTSGKNITVIEFAEDGKTEKKVDRSLVDELKALIDMQPPFVTFGEQFRRLQPTSDPSRLENKEQSKTMDRVFGLDKKDAAA